MVDSIHKRKVNMDYVSYGRFDKEFSRLKMGQEAHEWLRALNDGLSSELE